MKNTFLPILLTLLSTAALATHNRAGYIFYRQAGNLTVEATVVTWTRASSLPADRDTLTLCWGDGICERVARSNGPGSPPQGDVIGFDYKRNYYTAIHTYSQTGVYTIFMTDPNRNGGVLNVNFPNSDQIMFHIETTVTLLDVEGGMENHSPRVLASPILLGHLAQPFVYAPEAYDPDADSLSFELTVPLQDSGMAVPNYVELTEIGPGPGNHLSLDPHTGKLVWDSPQQPGLYGLAILIRSFRDGVEIGATILDLEILIGSNGNAMPMLSISPAYTESHLHCLSVGDTLELGFIAQDEDAGEEATLEFFSGFNEILTAPEGFSYTGSASGEAAFLWIVTGAQEREQPYQMTIRAVDGQGYADYRVLRFVVKGCADNEAGQQVSGICFWDANENGIQDDDETPLPNRPLTLSPAGLLTASGAEGRFAFYVPPGDYQLEVREDPCWYLTTDSAVYAIALEEEEEETRNFGFNRIFANDTEFAAGMASGPTRCNQEVPFWLALKNTACRPNNGWIALIRDENMASLASASQPPDQVSGDTLWWAFEPVIPGQGAVWELTFQLGGPEFLGMEMNFEMLVFSENCTPIGPTDIQGPWGQEELNFCARYIYSPELLCAYDPNDKLAQPARGEGMNYTLFDEKLEYTIRFQNTGNDTAFTVVLRDTLDPALDWATFEPFSSSHPYEFVLDQHTGVLIFTFRDINLPDSAANEVASQGFVSYTLSPRAGLPENTLAANRAGIYFDSNPPIMTNTTENTLVSQLPGTTAAKEAPVASGLQVKAYPNPFLEAVYFEIESPLDQRIALEIFDLAGRRVYLHTCKLFAGNATIQLSSLQLPGGGAFIYRVATRKEVSWGKIVVLD